MSSFASPFGSWFVSGHALVLTAHVLDLIGGVGPAVAAMVAGGWTVDVQFPLGPGGADGGAEGPGRAREAAARAVHDLGADPVFEDLDGLDAPGGPGWLRDRASAAPSGRVAVVLEARTPDWVLAPHPGPSPVGGRVARVRDALWTALGWAAGAPAGDVPRPPRIDLYPGPGIDRPGQGASFRPRAWVRCDEGDVERAAGVAASWADHVEPAGAEGFDGSPTRVRLERCLHGMFARVEAWRGRIAPDEETRPLGLQPVRIRLDPRGPDAQRDGPETTEAGSPAARDEEDATP